MTQGCPNWHLTAAPSAAPPPGLAESLGLSRQAGGSSSSVQAGRLSLPACAEQVLQDARPSGKRSPSANRVAEPGVIAHRTERNLDKLEA